MLCAVTKICNIFSSRKNGLLIKNNGIKLAIAILDINQIQFSKTVSNHLLVKKKGPFLQNANENKLCSAYCM